MKHIDSTALIVNDSTQKDSALKMWNDLYKPLENGFYTPTVDPFANSPTKIVVRSMVIDMEELNTNLASQSPHWNELEVYADVLIFPLHSETYGEFAFKLGRVGNQKATFFARAIHIVDENALFINYNKETQLIIYANEITGGELTFSGLQGNATASTGLKLQNGAVGLAISGSNTIASSVQHLPADLVALGSHAYWLLESSFNVGSALIHTHPDLAGRILSWTSFAAGFGEDIDLQHLSLNAANLQSYVMQLQRKIPFVPLLSQRIYQEIINNYLDAAQSFESAFTIQVASLDQLTNFDAFVKANKEYFTDQTDVAGQLIEQMKRNVNDAESLLTQNSDKLIDLVKRDGAVSQARKEFQDGVETYKKDQQNKAILGICKAVLEVGASVAAMAAGNEAAVGAAADGAVKVAKAGEVAAETVSKITQLVEAMKKITRIIKKIADLIDKLKGAMEAIQNLATANGLKISDFGNGILVPAGQDKEVFDNAYWEVFKLTIDDILTPYTTGNTNIDGASNYLKQLKILAIYGQAVYANQVTVSQLRQKLFKLVLEAEVTRNQKGRLDALVEQEGRKEEILQGVKIITYQNLLRVKSQVVFYMDEQAAALKYWAVKPTLRSDLLPSLGDAVGKLRDKLAQIEKERITAMRNFDSVEPMDVHLLIDSTDLLGQLQTSGELSLTIPIDHESFRGFGRVRIKRVRVYLNDEAMRDVNKAVSIDISTSAHYYDRYKGEQLLEYVSSPFNKRFVYRSKDKDHPIADGTVADEFEFSYFEPTPFTTWTIKILDRSLVNFAKLDNVTLHLTGSWAFI